MKNNLFVKINYLLKCKSKKLLLNLIIFFILSFSFLISIPTFANNQTQNLRVNSLLDQLQHQIKKIFVYVPYNTFLEKQYFGDNLIIRNSLSGKIGNLEYAPVTLDGRLVFQIASSANSLDIINDQDDNDDIDEMQILTVQDRAKVIENRLQSITEEGFDEYNLRIIPEILNNYDVLMISDNPNSQKRILVTFTEADFQLYRINKQEFIDIAAERLKQILIRAQRERQSSYLYNNVILAIDLIVRFATICLIAVLCQKLLYMNINANKVYLDKINNGEDIDDAKKLLTNNKLLYILIIPIRFINKQILFLGHFFYKYAQKIYLRIFPQQKSKKLTNIYKSASNYFRRIVICIRRIAKKLFKKKKKDLLIQKERLKQRIKTKVWLFRFSTLLIIWSLFINTIIILGLFPQTRSFGFWLMQKPKSLFTCWLTIYIANRVLQWIFTNLINVRFQEHKFMGYDFSREFLRTSTFKQTVNSTLNILAYILGLFFSLQILGVPIVPLLAGASILGLALSLSTQTLILSFVNGFLNLFNDSFAVGDYIGVANIKGWVEETTLFYARIRNLQGVLYTVPFSEVKVIENYTKDWSQVDYQVDVSYESNIDEALSTLQQVAEELSKDPQWTKFIIKPPKLFGVEQISHQGIKIRLILRTQPAKQWEIERELHRRIKIAFDQHGINIGIPKQSFLMSNSVNLLNQESID